MNALTIHGVRGVVIVCDPAVIKLRETQIDTSQKITSVSTASEYEVAAMVIKSLKGFTSTIEASRKAIKAEPLKITRQIDEIAESTAAPVEQEIKRLSELRNAFATLEAQRQAQIQRDAEAARKKREAEIEMARQVELARIKAEHAAKAKAEAEERAKKASENADAFAQIKAERVAEQAKARADAELLQAQQRAEQAAEDAKRKAEQAAVVAPSVIVKKVWNWHVINSLALANARPDLVTIEPKTRDINALVSGGLRELPGVKIQVEVVAK